MSRVIVPELEISPEAPLGPLARDYAQALLSGDRQTASQMIIGRVKTAEDVKRLYLYVFQLTQREIGRLWQTGQISVAQEHYCTAATQLIMSQLYPYIFTNEKIGRRLVATCVGGELHEVGMRMVADFFEMEGWDTYYLGANTPTKSILQTIEEQDADLLGISATMYFNVPQVKDLIAKMRASRIGRHIKILVGGYPFLISAELWKGTGADGFAQDAQEAISIGHRLINE